MLRAPADRAIDSAAKSDVGLTRKGFPADLVAGFQAIDANTGTTVFGGDRFGMPNTLIFLSTGWRTNFITFLICLVLFSRKQPSFRSNLFEFFQLKAEMSRLNEDVRHSLFHIVALIRS